MVLPTTVQDAQVFRHDGVTDADGAEGSCGVEFRAHEETDVLCPA